MQREAIHNMKSRRAFTLIELLVVIAIIAILAAILFPVFAQAKMAAKASASLSNCHQTATASEIYQTDVDDLPVLVSQDDQDAPLVLGGFSPYKPWAYLQQPYMKNADILQDPMTTKEVNSLAAQGLPDSTWYAYRTQYGYAYTVHSPVKFEVVNNQLRGVPHPVSVTNLGAPADTIKFVSKEVRGVNNGGDWLWLVPGSVVWGGNLVNPPALASDTQNTDPNVTPSSVAIAYQCWGGINGNNKGCATYATQPEEDGAGTGGVSLRKQGKAIVCMADTHARPMSPGQMAIGTNYSRSAAPYSVRMTDKTKYLWDQE